MNHTITAIRPRLAIGSMFDLSLTKDAEYVWRSTYTLPTFSKALYLSPFVRMIFHLLHISMRFELQTLEHIVSNVACIVLPYQLYSSRSFWV